MSVDGGPVEIGIIGGSGLYELLDDAVVNRLDSAWGPPSGAVTIGTLAGRRVAFLPRHGSRHEHAPHRVNYRANIDVLVELGVRQILAPCAVGSLTPELSAGTLAVPDQLVDFTRGRAGTFADDFGIAMQHASFADPYCARLRRILVESGRSRSWPAVDGGAMVVIEGPRFSTRAESRFYAAQGWTLVNMTALPEAALARERGVCYASLALVTDLDAGIGRGDSVTAEGALRVFRANVDRLRGVLAEAVGRLGDAAGCGCCD